MVSMSVGTPWFAWLLLLTGAVSFVEVVRQLDLQATLNAYGLAARKSRKILMARRISDHWKEKVLPVYARQLLTCSVRLLVILAAAIVPLLVLAAVATLLSVDLLGLAASVPGLLFASLGAMLFAWFRLPTRQA